jgi:TolB-like protein/Tfp pilus assembly protein PilF
VVAAAVAAVAVVVAGWWVRKALRTGPDRVQWAVVLPPENLMGDSTADYIVAGVHIDLISKLNQIPGLDVKARTSAMAYEDTDKTASQIASELSVDWVVETAVLRWGDSVRVSVALIDALPAERHVWDAAYCRPYGDMSLFGDVARDFAGQIQATLTPQDEALLATASLVDPQAYDAYQLGQFYLRTTTEESFAAAVQQFELAIEIDSTYAQAHAGLALTYFAQNDYGYETADQVYAKAKAAALRALELDDRLGEIYHALANVAFSTERDWPETGRLLRRAIELSPKYAQAHNGYAYWLQMMGRYDEAIMQQKRAVELDPLSFVLNYNLGRMYHFARDYDQAIHQFKRTIELDPDNTSPHTFLGLTYLQAETYEEGIAEIRFAHERASIQGKDWLLAYVYALTSRQEEALQILEELDHLQFRPGIRAIVCAALGDNDRAFQLLDEAYDMNSSWLFQLNDPMYDPLRDDPRFDQLLQRLGLACIPDSLGRPVCEPLEVGGT